MGRSPHRSALSLTASPAVVALLLALGPTGCVSPLVSIAVTAANTRAPLDVSSGQALAGRVSIGPVRELLERLMGSSLSLVPADEGDADAPGADSVLDQLRRKREQRRKEQGQPAARTVVHPASEDEETPAPPPAKHVRQEEPADEQPAQEEPVKKGRGGKAQVVHERAEKAPPAAKHADRKQQNAEPDEESPAPRRTREDADEEAVKKMDDSSDGDDATEKAVDLTPPRKKATRPALTPQQLASMKAAQEAASAKDEAGPVVGAILGGAVGVATLTGFIYYLAVRNPSLTFATHATWTGQ